MAIRVRIAPSPTGFAHVGTAYTALFNYAFAKKNKGKFIIRLEDTDIRRQVKGAEEAIYEGLSWLGLSWDEGPDPSAGPSTLRDKPSGSDSKSSGQVGKYGPYRQSERLSIYKKKADELLKRGLAYKEQNAVRFKNPGKEVSWKDLVRGEISFPGGEVTDFVLLKSDGYPTYNFAVVVDDILMRISHVIRGEEHISNTPRQLAIYEAFGERPPEFAHLPTLRNKERKKLSKRRDPVDIQYFRKEGYLPEALVNFLCLLGWSHPEGKEKFPLKEFIDNFDFKRVKKAGPIFDIKKLDWLNGEYIRRLTVDELSSKLKAQSSKLLKGVEDEKLKKITPLVQDRIKKLSEFEFLAGFFFKRPKINISYFGKSWKKHLKIASEVLDDIDNWNGEAVDKKLLIAVDKNKFKTGDFFMDLRVAITGSRVTPPINESIVILGKEKTVNRLNSAIKSSK